MHKIILGYDWHGPEGPWPNGLTLQFALDDNIYEDATYSISNNTNPYNLESKRHPFTFSKLDALLGGDFANLEYKPIDNIDNAKYIYEITPLLKPYQWLPGCFDYVSDTAKAHNRTGQNVFIINDMNEGYGNKTQNFFETIYQEIDKHNLNANNIWYITMNSAFPELHDRWCEDNNIHGSRLKVIATYMYEQRYNDITVTEKRKHFISLNRSPNPHRHAFVYELWRRGLLEYGYVSFPHKDEILDYNISIDDLELYGLDTSRWNEFLDSLPYTVDDAKFTTQSCTNFSIHTFYQESVFAVISEQMLDDHENLKFTEKLFHPLNNNCLPMFLFSPNMVKAVEDKLGYKTCYSDYDTILDDTERFNAVLDTLELICKQPLEDIINDTAETISHNAELFENRNGKYGLKGREEFLKEITQWLNS